MLFVGYNYFRLAFETILKTIQYDAPLSNNSHFGT